MAPQDAGGTIPPRSGHVHLKTVQLNLATGSRVCRLVSWRACSRSRPCGDFADNLVPLLGSPEQGWPISKGSHGNEFRVCRTATMIGVASWGLPKSSCRRTKSCPAPCTHADCRQAEYQVRSRRTCSGKRRRKVNARPRVGPSSKRERPA
jgi:hypothetical protein